MPTSATARRPGEARKTVTSGPSVICESWQTTGAAAVGDGRRRAPRAAVTRPGGSAAVADHAIGLVQPLLVEEVDRVLQHGVVAVVVLGDHEDIGVGPIDPRAPLLAVLVLVVAEPRLAGLVKERQVDLGEVNDLGSTRPRPQ